MLSQILYLTLLVGYIQLAATTPGPSSISHPITQNIVLKRIHSHNDYWRNVPFLTALSFGVSSVEADVWLVNVTLYVWHDMAFLTPDRTFDTLYVQPLSKSFTVNQTDGVFDTSPSTHLQLLVDIKTNGTKSVILPSILKALQPLRKSGTLRLQSSLIGTGNSPLDEVKALEPRDYFFDALLTQLNGAADYGAAVGWSGLTTIRDAQRNIITTRVNDAHTRGIEARFWELLNDGADRLNADDLEAASKF
ncbi:hypothetical protein EI94DRAFT_1770412 [Lactarius quietus]|nr:hypothetical protein EI94DRAFT_1770412 [Lactarius quietus]